MHDPGNKTDILKNLMCFFTICIIDFRFRFLFVFVDCDCSGRKSESGANTSFC